MCLFQVLAGLGCKTQDFRDTFENKALIGHVFKTEWASSDGHCESKCFIDDRCISYSYGKDANSTGWSMCELNESDHVMHPYDLIGRERTIYRNAENNCKCPSYKVCRVNWLDETHRCQCKEGFTGVRCDLPASSAEQTTTPSSAPQTTTASQSGGGGYSVVGSGSNSGWGWAQTQCVGKGGKLPSIHSADDNKKIKQLYSTVNAHMWIGISKVSWQTTAKWIDGSPVDYTNWATSDHASSDGCGYMDWEGKWYKTNCGHSLSFVCVK